MPPTATAGAPFMVTDQTCLAPPGPMLGFCFCLIVSTTDTKENRGSSG